MARTQRRFTAVMSVTLAGILSLPSHALAQSRADAPAPPPRASSPAARLVWTLIGGGIGFGAGLLLGFSKFDDATYAERKIMTTALIGAAIGGVAGAVLSKDAQPSFVPKKRPAFDEPIVAPRFSIGSDAQLRPRVADANRRAFAVGGSAHADTPAGTVPAAAAPVLVKRVKDDPLWEGMIAGAVIGAVAGGILIPATNCNTKTNPECPVIVGLFVGIPLTAAGAGLGALVDKLR